MGVDFYLACGDCHEFFELHKWSSIYDAGQFLVDACFEPGKYPGQRRPEDSPYPFVDRSAFCLKLLITAEQIEKALANMESEMDIGYIRELRPLVQDFARIHRGHSMSLSCDITDGHPWELDEPDFADWLELKGPFQFHHYLPRNLIDVDGLRSWDEVLARHGNDWPFQYGDGPPEADFVEKVRVAFEEHLTKRRR